MSAPWKKDKTTLEKVEDKFLDIVADLKLDERAADLKTQLKDLKLDERAVELKDQIASSDRFNELKDASAVRLGDLRSQLSSTPEPEPEPKSHKGRKFFLLALIGAGAAAFAYARKGAHSTSPAAPFSPPQPYTPPTSTKGAPSTTNGATAGAHADKS